MTITEETPIQEFINHILKVEDLEETFAGYLVEWAEDQLFKRNKYEDKFKVMIERLGSPENIESGIKDYIAFISTLHGQRKTVFLDMLEYAVKQNLVSSKLICESILTSTRTPYSNKSYWCSAFNVILKIIDKADYKEIRDLIKIMLDVMGNMPTNFNAELLPQIDSLYRVFEHVFDRNKALFPAYLVLDELYRKQYLKDGATHWKLSRLLSSFVDSFRPIANMCSIAGRNKLIPVVNYSSILGNSWKLDNTSGKFMLKGLLPYRNELFEPQMEILKNVLSQPYSKDFVCSMLNITLKQKQRCEIIEEALVDLMIMFMRNSEHIQTFDQSKLAECIFFWLHLSSQIIYFVYFHHASLSQILNNLLQRLQELELRTGREQLMWALLHFVSGVMLKNPIDDILPVLRIYDYLYPEKEPLPLPPMDKITSVHHLSAAATWIIFLRKADNDQLKVQRSIPNALKSHVEFLKNSANISSSQMNLNTDFTLAAVFNESNGHHENFSRIGSLFVEYITGNTRNQPNPSPSSGQMISTNPISMSVLDSLCVHSKVSLDHAIVNHIMSHAQKKITGPLPPGVMETFSRLLVYLEVETLNIKSMLGQLLVTAWKYQAWNVFHSLLEMFSYRLNHFPSHFRVQMLSQMHSLYNQPQTNTNQLQLCIESTVLRLILSLSSGEIMTVPTLTRYQNETKSLISSESEELNKVLILTLARAIHVTKSETLSADWCKELLSNISQITPIVWSTSTLQCFPPVIRDFYAKAPSPKDHKAQLKQKVEEEYRKWILMNTESEILNYFSQPSNPPFFFCLVWKMMVETDRFNPATYKVRDQIGCRGLMNHLRCFVDFLVSEISTAGSQQLNKYVEALNDICWKHHLVTLDRLMLCIVLRNFEGNEAHVCLFTIQHLLLKTNDFKCRVEEFVRDNSPEYWKQNNWHEHQYEFLKKYPEKLYYDAIYDPNSQWYPVQFSNICLRFLPILDMIIHRYLEQSPNNSVPVEPILDQLGCLYKFHFYPINFLYNTLHYYEPKLKNKHLKKKLVACVFNAFKETRPRNWAFSDQFIGYLNFTADEWKPDLDYYIRLIGRFVDTFNGLSVFPFQDWRFNEFTSVSAHALHVICTELMALPVPVNMVANSLIDIILLGHKTIPRANIMDWMNAVGLILTALPDSYWQVLNDRILQMMHSPLLNGTQKTQDMFRLLDFTNQHSSLSEQQISYLIALAHSMFQHASIGQLSVLPQFLQERVKFVIRTEEQFLFICHIVAPFLQRFLIERTRIVMEVTKELYEMLEIVDKHCEKLYHMDTICDFFYLIKYMFTGDSVKNDVERCILNLRPQLQLRLRYITHMAFQQNVSASLSTSASAIANTPVTTPTTGTAANVLSVSNASLVQPSRPFVSVAGVTVNNNPTIVTNTPT